MTSRGTLRSLLKGPILAGIVGGVVGALLWSLAAPAASPAPVATAPDVDGRNSDSLPETANASDAPLTAGAIYERSGESVAFIEAEQGGAPAASPFEPLPQQGGTASGSGFLMDDEGHVLTNAHVVEGSDSVTVRLGEDDEPLEAEVLGLDTSTDVAVLAIDPAAVDVDPLPLGDSGEIAVGDAVVAIGNPFGLDRTVTTGIVSALQRQISAPDGFTISDVIQTDAAINPGNSGGPLFNADGEVIGINSQIATAGGEGSVGVGFAVPVDTVRNVAKQILDDGTAEHAFIGISGTDAESGILVGEVTPDGPADLAGIQAEADLIVAANGQELAGMEDLIAIVNAKEPGDEVELEVQRGGETRTVTVELGNR